MKEGGRHQLGNSVFPSFEAWHGKVATKVYQTTYNVCGPWSGYVVMEMVPIGGASNHRVLCGDRLWGVERGYCSLSSW